MQVTLLAPPQILAYASDLSARDVAEHSATSEKLKHPSRGNLAASRLIILRSNCFVTPFIDFLLILYFFSFRGGCLDRLVSAIGRRLRFV